MTFFRKLTDAATPKVVNAPIQEIDTSRPQPTISLDQRPQKNIRVNFSNRGLNKVIKSVRSLEKSIPDQKTLLNVAQILSDVKIEKKSPIGFKSIVEFLGLDYVGYIVDKERYNKRTGKWDRIDEYKIVGLQANSFKDSRVAYGNIYRYRIKSIIKVTTSVTKESLEAFELVENVRRQERDAIKEQLRIKQDVIAGIARITNVGLSSKSSAGKAAGLDTFDLFNGLKVHADESRTTVVKVPVVDVRDNIRNLRQLKNLNVIDSDLMKGTISKDQLQKQINKNLQRVREKIVEYISFYYESAPSKEWQYVDVSENIPPPAPSSIKIIPNSLKREIFLSWLKPANSQRDIKFYRVYKRKNLGDAWLKLATLNEQDNIYVDVNLDPEDTLGHIYALTCVDAHGIESFLSAQIRAKLNRNYAAEGKEHLLKWVSGGGTTPQEVGIIFKAFEDTEKPIIAKRNFVIRPTNEFSEAEKKLIIRVTSLDTHEEKEFNVTLKNVNIGDDDLE